MGRYKCTKQPELCKAARLSCKADYLEGGDRNHSNAGVKRRVNPKRFMNSTGTLYICLKSVLCTPEGKVIDHVLIFGGDSVRT